MEEAELRKEQEKDTYGRTRRSYKQMNFAPHREAHLCLYIRNIGAYEAWGNEG